MLVGGDDEVVAVVVGGERCGWLGWRRWVVVVGEGGRCWMWMVAVDGWLGWR